MELDRFKLLEKKQKLSDAAQEFITKKVEKLQEEGYPYKQAVAIAFSYAKKEGYHVGKNPNESLEAVKALSYLKLYEDFNSAEQKELDQITTWLSGTTEEMDDWEWDGELLTIFLDGEEIEKYTKSDLEGEGVFK